MTASRYSLRPLLTKRVSVENGPKSSSDNNQNGLCMIVKLHIEPCARVELFYSNDVCHCTYTLTIGVLCVRSTLSCLLYM